MLIGCLADPDLRVWLSVAEKILTNAYKGMEPCELEERLLAIEQKNLGALRAHIPKEPSPFINEALAFDRAGYLARPSHLR